MGKMYIRPPCIEVEGIQKNLKEFVRVCLLPHMSSYRDLNTSSRDSLYMTYMLNKNIYIYNNMSVYTISYIYYNIGSELKEVDSLLIIMETL